MLFADHPQIDPARSYVIASSPRTGSYLLCEGLASTGVAGRPTEPFCIEYRAEFCKRWSLRPDVEFNDFLAAVLRHGTTGNGVFGMKIHWSELRSLAGESGLQGPDFFIFRHIFPVNKFIYIRRGDRRFQAISYYRALVTREWWRIEGVENRQANGSTAAFDSTKIRQLESYLAYQEYAWRWFFSLIGAEPLVIEYETLWSRYKDEIGRALHYLGFDSTFASQIPEPRLKRQSDETTQLWRQWLDEEDRRAEQPQRWPNEPFQCLATSSDKLCERLASSHAMMG
jgi:trehalose 2-sulfotransferase